MPTKRFCSRHGVEIWNFPIADGLPADKKAMLELNASVTDRLAKAQEPLINCGRVLRAFAIPTLKSLRII